MTEEQVLKGQVLTNVGDPGKDAVYELILPLSTVGGYLGLSFSGHATAPIPYPPTREQVREALAALVPIGDLNNIEVEGVRGGPFRFFMRGELGAQALPPNLFPFTANGANLVEPVQLNVNQIELGKAQVLKPKLEILWTNYASIVDLPLRALYCKRDLLKDLRGIAKNFVDTATNERRESASQMFRNLTNLYNECLGEISQATGGAMGDSTGAQQALTGRIQKRTSNGADYGQLLENPYTGEIY
jgi:hypothetical protein